jgi:hypothetical protein
VTKPVEFFEFEGEATLLIKWVGELDQSTSYLGRWGNQTHTYRVGRSIVEFFLWSQDNISKSSAAAA